VDLRRVASALSNNCLTDSDCVPLNIFGGQGSITQEMVNYITRDTDDRNNNRLHVFEAGLNSDIWQLPAGNVNMSLSYQYRNEKVYQTLDELFISKSSVDTFSFANTRGSVDVNEVSMKLAIPLTENLGLNLASNYAKFDFTQGEFSGGMAVNFMPTKSLQLNLQYSINRNAPNLIELYRDTSSVDNQSFSDPCEGNSELPGCPSGAGNFVSDVFASISFSGNPQLELEKSKFAQLSLEYRPEQVENLRINVQLFKQKVSNLVSKISAQRTINACAYTGTVYCDNITRLDTTPFYVTEVRTQYENDGELATSGIDLRLDYRLITQWADFDLNWQSVYLKDLTFSEKNYVLNNTSESSILSLENNNRELPRIKSNLNLGMHKDNWSLNYQWRYVAGYEERCNIPFDSIQFTDNPNAVGGVIPEDFRWCTYGAEILSTIGVQPTLDELQNLRHVGGTTFQDLNITYHLSEYNTKIVLGVENVFDKTPPLSAQAGQNSYYTYLYNGTGRFFWVRLSKEF